MIDLPSIIFEVTARCNLACRYCYVPWEAPGASLEAPADDSYEAADRTLTTLFEHATVGTLTMTGGEPLLQPRLPELVLKARLAGCAVNVISNGTVGDRETLASLVSLGVSLFELPLHARDAAVHDRLVGHDGAHARVLETVSHLQELGGEVVGVIVLCRENAPRIADTLRYHAELGLRRTMLNRFNPGGRGLAHHRELALPVAELQQAFVEADRAARRLPTRVTSNVGLPHCLVDPRQVPHVRLTSCSADVDRRPLALDLDGGLRFCNHSPVVFANIHRDPPGTWLAGDYLERWRRTVPTACADCARFDRCFGGCRAASEQVGGTLADVDPLLSGDLP